MVYVTQRNVCVSAVVGDDGDHRLRSTTRSFISSQLTTGTKDYEVHDKKLDLKNTCATYKYTTRGNSET